MNLTSASGCTVASPTDPSGLALTSLSAAVFWSFYQTIPLTVNTSIILHVYKCINRYIIVLIFYFVCCSVQWHIGQKAFICVYVCGLCMFFQQWMDRCYSLVFFTTTEVTAKNASESKKKVELLLLCNENTTKFEQYSSKMPQSHIHDIKHINWVKNAQLFINEC